MAKTDVLDRVAIATSPDQMGRHVACRDLLAECAAELRAARSIINDSLESFKRLNGERDDAIKARDAWREYALSLDDVCGPTELVRERQEEARQALIEMGEIAE